MANNCWNNIEIFGSKEELQNLEKFLLENDYHSLLEKFGHGDNPRWFDMLITLDDEDMRVSGDSAWCPALELFTDISKLFKVKMEYYYEESGCDFGGKADISDGNIDDDCLSYEEYLIKYGDMELLSYRYSDAIECEDVKNLDEFIDGLRQYDSFTEDYEKAFRDWVKE